MSADGYIRIERPRAGAVELRCWECSRPIVAGRIERDHPTCIGVRENGERILRYSIEILEAEQY